MAESGLIQRPERIDFTLVGKQQELMRSRLNVDIGGSFLMKKEHIEKLLAGQIDLAYARFAPDSEEWRNRRGRA